MRDPRETSRVLTGVGAAVLLAALFGLIVSPLSASLSDAVQAIVVQVGVMLVPPILVCLISRERLAREFALKGLRPRHALAAVIAAAAAFVVLLAIVIIQDRLFRRWGISLEEEQRAFTEKIGDIRSDGAWIFFLALAVFPAVCEEFYFRGFLQTRLTKLFGARGVLYVALLFGIMHAPPIDRVVPMTLFGLLLGFLVSRTGSIWSAVIVHGANNGLIVLCFSCDINSPDRLSPIIPLAGLAALGLVIGYLAAERRRVCESSPE